MKYILILLSILLAGCANPGRPTASKSPSESPTAPAHPAFEKLTNDFVYSLLAFRPQIGTALGLHQFDGRITDYSPDSLASYLVVLKKIDAQARALARQGNLSPRENYDLTIIRTALARDLFAFEQRRAFWENPMTYADTLDVNIYIKRNFAPFDQRVRSIIAIEKQAPAIFRAARQNLQESLPRPFVELAIEIATGSADFLGKDLVAALHELKNPPLLQEFNAVNAKAIAELRSYAAWLKETRLPKAHDRYALGANKYRMMLSEELITLTPQEILELGMKQLRHEQQVFAETARRIDPSKKPIDVFRAIQKDHPTAEGLIPDTRKNLEAIRQFVIDRKIVTMPTEVRVKVEETPAYARATSFASMDTPGAFETKATEAYYYVTPVEEQWPATQKEEWLTAFNYYTTDIVTIHEAYPGHYTQFVSLNASDATLVEKCLSSYAFTEGWAHYTEQMLVDEGFGQSSQDPQHQDKYRLAQSDEALLRLCRLCVSVRMHTQNMTVDEGAKFFEENCYYEEKPSRQEALRGTFDPGYLYYTLGKLQILKLREDYKAQEGDRFSLQKFHDEFLRHGAPPIPLLRPLLLKDPSLWSKVL